MTTEEAGAKSEAVPTGVQLTALDPTFQIDPYPVLAKLRELDPVHHDTMLGRYVLTRHQDVDDLLWDRSLSVDPRNAAPGSFEAMFGFGEGDGEPSMLFSDPPYHTRLRGLVSKAFTAKAVEQMRPRIQEIVDELLDAIDPSAGSRPDRRVRRAATDDRDRRDARCGSGGPRGLQALV